MLVSYQKVRARAHPISKVELSNVPVADDHELWSGRVRNDVSVQSDGDGYGRCAIGEASLLPQLSLCTHACFLVCILPIVVGRWCLDICAVYVCGEKVQLYLRRSTAA